jgi:hypothetical protein
MELRTDPARDIDELGSLVALATQADGLEPSAARVMYADILARLERLQRDLLADEGTLRHEGYGHTDVPAALDAIERYRQALRRMETAVEGLCCV